MNLLGSALAAIKPRHDDTLVDRLNYYYSVGIVIVIAITLTAKQYVGQPIQCWVPSEFSKAWEQYAENYCFVHNTYWVRADEIVPQQLDERTNRQLIYYQWVPFLMALEAGLFYLPMIFWSRSNTRSGLNIAGMVRITQGIDTTEYAQRQNAIAIICQHFEDTLELRYVWRAAAARTRFDCVGLLGMRDGSFVANMFIFTKLLYIANIIGQFVMMNQFLGQNNHTWGADILRDVIEGRNWELSGNFPRIALCDFTVRTLSNVHRYSIQCVLVLNMFNEKIFLFLYWWLVIVGLMTVWDMLFWSANIRYSGRRISYMKRFIRVPAEEERAFRQFCDRILGADGTMLLRMISAHANELFTQDALKMLWDNYRRDLKLSRVVSDARIRPLVSRRRRQTTSGSLAPLATAAANELSEGLRGPDECRLGSSVSRSIGENNSRSSEVSSKAATTTVAAVVQQMSRRKKSSHLLIKKKSTMKMGCLPVTGALAAFTDTLTVAAEQQQRRRPLINIDVPSSYSSSRRHSSASVAIPI